MVGIYCTGVAKDYTYIDGYIKLILNFLNQCHGKKN
jgi:hypothetical protein